jgi:hypothetical protein
VVPTRVNDLRLQSLSDGFTEVFVRANDKIPDDYLSDDDTIQQHGGSSSALPTPLPAMMPQTESPHGVVPGMIRNYGLATGGNQSAPAYSSDLRHHWVRAAHLEPRKNNYITF